MLEGQGILREGQLGGPCAGPVQGPLCGPTKGPVANLSEGPRLRAELGDAAARAGGESRGGRGAGRQDGRPEGPADLGADRDPRVLLAQALERDRGVLAPDRARKHVRPAERHASRGAREARLERAAYASIVRLASMLGDARHFLLAGWDRPSAVHRCRCGLHRYVANAAL